MKAVLRRVFAAPQSLYRHDAGWLLGHRFLQLRHEGRRTGLERRVVLEVVRWDAGRRAATVVSGFGAKSDWLRNIEANGRARIDIGRQTFEAGFRRLPMREAAAVFQDYEQRNRLVRPVVRMALSRLLGWRYDGSPEALERLADELPVVEFSPLDTTADG